MSQPIVKGGGSEGFLQYFVPNTSKEEIISSAIIILNFKDVSGKNYSIQFDFKTHQDITHKIYLDDVGKLQNGVN